MDDLGFIVASYVLTLGGMAGYAWWVVRRGRRLAARLPEEDTPWT
jgi:hypothetical protein